MHIFISSQKLETLSTTGLLLQYHSWPHRGHRLLSWPNMWTCDYSFFFIVDICKAWLAFPLLHHHPLLLPTSAAPLPTPTSTFPFYSLSTPPFTHSLSLFFLISLFSVDLWFHNIQLQNLMECRWKEMRASRNITIKIKTRQQKLSQRNYRSFRITVLESFKRLLTSCDLEKSSLDILYKLSFCTPHKRKNVLQVWSNIKWQNWCFWVNYCM